MVSRSRQSDSIIAGICQAALRYKRHNKLPIYTLSTQHHCCILRRFFEEEFRRTQNGSGSYNNSTRQHHRWNVNPLKSHCRPQWRILSLCKVLPQQQQQQQQHLHFSLVTVQEAQKGFCGCKTGLLQRTSSSPRRLFLPVVYVTTSFLEKKKRKNKSQEKGGTDRISRNRGNVEYSSLSIPPES